MSRRGLFDSRKGILGKLLILGGSPFQVPAIVQAVKRGHRVVSCDYLPDNPGHRYSHEYYNVSTTDCEAVLALARDLSVDGILAFASDPAAVTAAYVSSAMNLPGNRPEAVHRLTDKIAFRNYLQEYGFKTPNFAAAATLEMACSAASAIGFPVMIKPCDSSGSKGVSRAHDIPSVSAAFEEARRHSRGCGVIIERWLPRSGAQIAGDGLVLDGQLVFGCFGDEHFDLECCPHAPVGESFPGELSANRREELFEQLQQLFSLLGVRNLVFNLDAMIDVDGDLVLIEVGPRAGGNCLPQVIQAHTGVDLTDIAIQLALGQPVAAHLYRSTPAGFHASWMIHSTQEGSLGGFRVAPDIAPHVREIGLIARPGATVRRFTSSADTLGYALLSFPGAVEMAHSLRQMGTLIEPVLT